MKKIFITALLLVGFNAQGFADTEMIELPSMLSWVARSTSGLNKIMLPPVGRGLCNSNDFFDMKVS